MGTSIEIADREYQQGTMMCMGDKNGLVALNIQSNDQKQRTPSQQVALPHDQMLLAVVAPWFEALPDDEQKKILRTLYARRETRFLRQPRPVEMDKEPEDFDTSYLQEKGWTWQPKEQGPTPFTALLYHDGLTLRTEQSVITIPKDVILELCQWLFSQTEWFDPQGASYQADPKEDFGGYTDCIYCMSNLPHTEQQHEHQLSIPSDKFYDDGITPDPIDGQY